MRAVLGSLTWNYSVESEIISPSIHKLPHEMSNCELVVRVKLGFQKIEDELPFIEELHGRFAQLPRGHANIGGCRTWEEFCTTVLHRTPRRIQQVLANLRRHTTNKVDSRFWLTPKDLLAQLDNEFHFDYDPCPYPLPDGFDGTAVPWGRSNFINPPFRRSDAYNGKGPTAFALRAIQEQARGNSSVLTLPCHSYVNALLLAGAEIRPLGRVAWENPKGQAWRGPTSVCMFVLRGTVSEPNAE